MSEFTTTQPAKTWTCHLFAHSPRYTAWLQILGTTEVPIINPIPFAALLGQEQAEVHQLDLTKLDQAQRQRLIDFIVARFGEERANVEAELLTVGFPIRAADVVVAMNLACFI